MLCVFELWLKIIIIIIMYRKFQASVQSNFSLNKEKKAKERESNQLKSRRWNLSKLGKQSFTKGAVINKSSPFTQPNSAVAHN